MLDIFWSLLKEPPNRDAITWIGSGFVVVIGGFWTFLKYFNELKKLRPDTEEKEQAKIARLAATRKDEEGIRFEYIRLDAQNTEWCQLNVSEFSESKNNRIFKAQKMLGGADLSQLLFVEIKHPLENSCPSFEIVVVNVARQPVSLLEIGARIVYLAHVDWDMMYGGAPESGAHELLLQETFIIDVSSLMGRHGAYVNAYLLTDEYNTLFPDPALGAPYLSNSYDPPFRQSERLWEGEDQPDWAEWKCNTFLMSEEFKPFIIPPEERFRYKVVFKGWPVFMSAILQMEIKTPLGNRLSNPLYIRYGND
jgi:hypothetical protein